ncbi:hypothetical protein BKP44_07000 [Formosa algae]|nr:hypothetical protein AST99_02300 [Formosa algae]PNW28785.1 hypothetical protein BKP44_07000 [Formosa algae]
MLVMGSLFIFKMTSKLESSEKHFVKAIQDEHKDIDVAVLPTAVTQAVKKDFKAATISKAYVTYDEDYKLELNVNSSIKTVYITAIGIWISK